MEINAGELVVLGVKQIKSVSGIDWCVWITIIYTK